MRRNKLLIGALTAAVVLVGGRAAYAAPSDRPCVIGKRCTIEGRAAIFPFGHNHGQDAAIELPSGDCIALALPDALYRRGQKYTGRAIRVSGRVYEQPLNLEGGGMVLSYELKSRRIAGGVCEGQPVIYVDRFRLLESGVSQGNGVDH